MALLSRLHSLSPLSANAVGAAVLRGAGGSALVNAAGIALALILQVALARLLSLHEFGLYIYAATWLAMLTVLASGGMDTSALRYVSGYLASGDNSKLYGFLRYARLRVALFAVGAATVVFVAANLVAAKTAVSMAVFLIGGFVLPINVLLALNGAVLQALQHPVQSQALQMVLRTCLMLGALTLWHFGAQVADAATTMALNLIAGALTLGIMWVLVQHRLPRTAKGSYAQESKEWGSTSALFFTTSVFQLLLSQVDILVVGMLMEMSDAGIYAVASRLATLVTFAITAVNAYLAPRIAYLYTKGDRELLQATVTVATRGVALYTVSAALVLVLLGRSILGLFGADFVGAYPVLVILAGGQMIIGLCGSVGFLLAMTGHQKEALYTIGCTAGIAVVLNVTLIPILGLEGAALATLLAIAARSVVLCVLVVRKLRINPTVFALKSAN